MITFCRACSRWWPDVDAVPGHRCVDSHSVNVKLTFDEYTQVQAAASRAAEPVTRWMRAAIRERLVSR